MSIVIAKKTKNGFIFGADSQVTCGSRKGTTIKIFKSRKEEGMFIGVVGCLRDCQILEKVNDLLDVNAIRREELDEFSIIDYTVPKLMKELEKEHRLVAEKDGTIGWDSCTIIVYKDKAFKIDGDFTVEEIKDFAAIGSPQDFASGSYETLKELGTKLSDRDLVKEIIRITIAHNNYVDFPIRIIDTSKDKDFTIINAKVSIEEPKKSATTKKTTYKVENVEEEND